MRRLTLLIQASLIVGGALVGTAQAEDLSTDMDAQKADKFPLSAGASISYRFGHANFIESNGDFGSQSLSVSPNLGYQLTKKISLGLSIGATKALDTSYFYSGTASKNVKAPWEVSDVSFSASYGSFYKIPKLDISLKSYGVISLHQRIQKLMNRNGLLGLKSLTKVITVEHSRDCQLGS